MPELNSLVTCSFTAGPIVASVAAPSFGVSTTPFLLDSFTDSNGTNLTAHTPTVSPSGAKWVVPIGSAQITSNKAVSSANGGLGMVMEQTAPTDDYQIQCTLTGASGGTGDGPGFRGPDATGNNLIFLSSNGSPDVVKVQQFVAGVESNLILATAPNTTTPRAYEVDLVGPCMTAFVNGVLVQAGTIDKFTNGRQFGFRLAGTVGANSIGPYATYSISKGTPFARQFSQAAQQILVDTDMGTDADDIGAILVLHGLQTLNECNIVACVTGTTAQNSLSALYAINNYKGRAAITLGVNKSGTFTSTGTDTNNLAGSASATGAPTVAATQDAVTVMRAKLNAAAANDLVIVTIGYLNNMAALLASASNAGGDGILLTGLQLVTQKCKRWVVMGGSWGYASNAAVLPVLEFNFNSAATDTTYCFNNFPFASVPFYGDGYEIGIVQNTNINTALTGVIARPMWDPVATLFAVRGTGPNYWLLNQGRAYSISGGCGYVPDPNGNAFFIRESLAPASVATIINTLAGT